MRSSSGHLSSDGQSPIHVVQIIRSAGAGGVESHVATLSRCLVERGSHATLVSLANDEAAPMLVVPGVTIICLSDNMTWSWRTVGAFFEPLKLLKRLNCDIVHCHRARPVMLGALADRPCGKRCIVRSLHGASHSVGRNREHVPVIKLFFRIDRQSVEPRQSHGRIRTSDPISHVWISVDGRQRRAIRENRKCCVFRLQPFAGLDAPAGETPNAVGSRGHQKAYCFGRGVRPPLLASRVCDARGCHPGATSDCRKDLVVLEEVAERSLDNFGFRAKRYHEEAAAIANVASDAASGRYPLLVTSLDTSGEKPYEDFAGESELPQEAGFKNLMVVISDSTWDRAEVLQVVEAIARCIDNPDIHVEQDLVDLLRRVIPKFMHSETGKKLDDRV